MPAAQLRPWLCLGWARSSLRSPIHWVGFTLIAAVLPLLGVLSQYGALPLRGAPSASLVNDVAWMGAVAGVGSGVCWLGRADGLVAGVGEWTRWWHEWALLMLVGLVGALAAVLTAPEPWDPSLGAALRASALGLIALSWLRRGATAAWALIAVAVVLPAASSSALGASWPAQVAWFLVTPSLELGGLAASLGLLVMGLPPRWR